MKCKSFKPSIDYNSRILILGSMPGVKSLEASQYYAHPQNRFWRVMGILCACNEMPSLKYNEKLKVLLNNKIALWDTIKCCEREGSLDSEIEKEIPNDIKGLLKRYHNIKILCLNGNKSFSMFKKHFPELLKTKKCLKLPSTSPANARFRLEDLINEWRIITQTNELI